MTASVYLQFTILLLAQASSVVLWLLEGLSQIIRLRSVFICTHSLKDSLQTGATVVEYLYLFNPDKKNINLLYFAWRSFRKKKALNNIFSIPLTAKRWRTES